MIEMQLLWLLILCVITTTIWACIILRNINVDINDTDYPLLIIPISKKTTNIEFIIRELIYKINEQDLATKIVVLDCGADEEVLNVFFTLMDGNDNYKMIKLN